MPIPGPITFSIEGTFTEKPRLLMDGADVPYDSLSVAYIPEEKYEYKDELGNQKEEVFPEYISLSFSLSAQVGQLEANVSYRVKANAEGEFVLEQTDDIVHAAKKPPFPPKKKDEEKKGDDKGKDGEKKDKGKPDFMKKKKGKSVTIKAKVGFASHPDAGTRPYQKNTIRDILSGLVEDKDE